MTARRENGGLRLALTTLTILPVKGGAIDRTTARGAMTWAPAVGASVGAVAAVAVVGMRYLTSSPGLPRLLPAVVGIAVLAFLTRGLHLDGLADSFDSFGIPDRTRALAAMRRPEIGAFGVVALVLVLLLQVSGLAAADVVQHGTRALVCAAAAGRVAITWACMRGVPSARDEGLGALVAGTLPRAVPAAWTSLLVVVGAGWAWFDDRGRLEQAVAQAVAIVVALGIAWLLQDRLVRRLGGITGDVLGAVCEVATAVALVLAAAASASSAPPFFRR